MYNLGCVSKKFMEINMEETTFTKLPDSELEVMQAIWALDNSGERYISAGLIVNRFPMLQRIKLTTVLTLINRLISKGFISSKHLGRANCYSPLISLIDYRKCAAKDFIEKVYLGNKTDLLDDIKVI